MQRSLIHPSLTHTAPHKQANKYSFIHPLPHSLILFSCIVGHQTPLIHPLTHSPTHSLIHPLLSNLPLLQVQISLTFNNMCFSFGSRKRSFSNKYRHILTVSASTSSNAPTCSNFSFSIKVTLFWVPKNNVRFCSSTSAVASCEPLFKYPSALQQTQQSDL